MRTDLSKEAVEAKLRALFVAPKGVEEFVDVQEIVYAQAARIDTLEKALDAAEVLANEVQDLPDGPYHAMYAALCQYRVARDALPPKHPDHADTPL